MGPSPDRRSIIGPLQPDREVACDLHGPYLSRNYMRSIWSKCPACVADERAQQEAEQERQRIAARRERMDELLKASAIPKRFVGRRFDNFVAATRDHQSALTIVRDFAEGFDDHARRGSGLILAGLPGTGKSHLAAALLQALIDRKSVRYTTALDMIRSLRDTWRKDSIATESEVMTALQRLDLLVIDEVGATYGSEGEQVLMFDVLDRRYREVKSTVLLTNQDKSGLRQYLGDRTFDRLTETARWVAFDWPSYRPQARKESAQ